MSTHPSRTLLPCSLPPSAFAVLARPLSPSVLLHPSLPLPLPGLSAAFSTPACPRSPYAPTRTSPARLRGYSNALETPPPPFASSTQRNTSRGCDVRTLRPSSRSSSDRKGTTSSIQATLASPFARTCSSSRKGWRRRSFLGGWSRTSSPLSCQSGTTTR